MEGKYLDFGIAVLGGLFVGSAARHRRFKWLAWIGWLLIAIAGISGFIRADAWAGECDGVRGYWTAARIDGNETGDHAVSSNSIEVRNDEFGPANVVATMTIETDPASWGSCVEIPVSIDYTLAVIQCDECASWMAVDTFADSNINPFHTPSIGSNTIGIGIHPGQGREVKVVLSGRKVQGYTKATVSSSVKEFPVAPERLSNFVKRDYKRVIALLNRVEAGTAVAAGMYAVTATASGSPDDAAIAAILGLAGTVMHASSLMLTEALDADPWDKDFKKIARPKALPVPSTIKRIPRARAWARNMREIEALATALYKSINRANTAFAMGDLRAEDRQQGKIDSYVRRLGLLFGKEADFRASVSEYITKHPAPIADPELIDALVAAEADR